MSEDPQKEYLQAIPAEERAIILKLMSGKDRVAYMRSLPDIERKSLLDEQPAKDRSALKEELKGATRVEAEEGVRTAENTVAQAQRALEGVPKGPLQRLKIKELRNAEASLSKAMKAAEDVKAAEPEQRSKGKWHEFLQANKSS